jgi:integrase
MYIVENKQKAKVGVVKVDIFQKYYRLRFTYPKGKRHSIYIPGGLTDEAWILALRRAQLISTDILAGTFDETYQRYCPERSQAINVVAKVPNIRDLWEAYKKANAGINAVTTQIEPWKQTDRCLSKVSTKALDLNQVENLIPELLQVYSVGTLERVLANLKAACNLAIRQGHIDKNPFIKVKLPKRAKNRPECFSTEEIRAILGAFYSDEFASKYAPVKPSWYAYYVEFLALTFCRPEEAIALTLGDIKRRSDGTTFIAFNKAHSRKTLKATKTHEIRLFKCNPQLKKFLDDLPYIDNPNSLLFPAPKGGYIDQRGFGRDVWKPLVTKLVEVGRVQKYLKCYCLRHSGITRLVRVGYDIATIASLAGTSPEMVIRNYLVAKEDIDLPEM